MDIKRAIDINTIPHTEPDGGSDEFSDPIAVPDIATDREPGDEPDGGSAKIEQPQRPPIER